MEFNFIQAAPELAPYVEFMVQMDAAQAMRIRNFPAASINLVFNYGDDLREHGAGADSKLHPRITLEGFHNGPMEYTSGDRTGLIIVALKPTARVVLKDLGGAFPLHGNLPLDQVYHRQAREFAERLQQDRDPVRKLTLTERFLREIIAPAEVVSPRVAEAVDRIETSGGLVPVADLGRELGVSKRQLDRVFQAEVGTSPKHYSRVIRMRNSLRLIRGSDLSLTDVAQEAGYYDQAHFIKDFRGFTGLTPRDFREFRKAAARDYARQRLVLCDGNITLPAASRANAGLQKIPVMS